MKWVPKHVPLLIPYRSNTTPKWIAFLNKYNLLEGRRIIHWDERTVYYAKVMYQPTELARSVRTRYQWTSHTSSCGYRNGLPGYLMREMVYGNNLPARLRRIVIIDRSGGGGEARSIINQVHLNQLIRDTFPEFEILLYKGSHPTIDEAVGFFNQSALCIGAHGAGLGFISFLPSTSAVVEIGHRGADNVRYPDWDFPSYAHGLGLDHSITLAEGGHKSPITANLTEVRILSIAALVRIGILTLDDQRVVSIPPFDHYKIPQPHPLRYNSAIHAPSRYTLFVYETNI